MEIGEGQGASLAFLNIMLGEHPEFSDVKVDVAEVERVRRLLEEYCELDTLGEVLIINELNKIAKGKG